MKQRKSIRYLPIIHSLQMSSVCFVRLIKYVLFNFDFIQMSSLISVINIEKVKFVGTRFNLKMLIQQIYYFQMIQITVVYISINITSLAPEYSQWINYNSCSYNRTKVRSLEVNKTKTLRNIKSKCSRPPFKNN